MILPNNGKVVVFDDKRVDVENLLKALSKEKIPYLFYQDEFGTDLPDGSPVENVRLVILDLELATNNPDPKNLIAPIAQRFKKVLPPNNTYILIYWSTKEDKYKSALEQEFTTGLKDYRPIKILSLNKAKANADSSPLKYISDELKREMKEFSSLNAFMLWESSVNKAAGTITNDLSSIFTRDSNWDKNIYNLLFKLAIAQAGRDTMDVLDNKAKLKSALEIVNSSLIETAERIISEEIEDIDIGEIKEGGRGMTEEEVALLNAQLHFIQSEKLHHFFAGNLYIKDLNGIGNEIIEKNFRKSVHAEIKASSPKLACLDITPSCDYSQNKNFSRILHGLVLDKKYQFDGPKDYFYHQCPPIILDGKRFICFDFRYLYSFTKPDFEASFADTPKLRLRNGLLLDIQAQLSNHINRPGIISIRR